MFVQSAFILLFIAPTAAVPLSSHHLSSMTENCDVDIPSQNAVPAEDFFPPQPQRYQNYVPMEEDFLPLQPLKHTRTAQPHCDVSNPQPAVRLGSFANTGTTWTQFLLEEATRVATQNPQSVIVQAGRPSLYPGDPVMCRADCGAQMFLSSNCTAGSPESNGVRLALNATPEIFKNHYPDFKEPYAMFETDNPIQKTIILVRNPLDTYLAQFRHVHADSPEKVGEDEAVIESDVKENEFDGELYVDEGSPWDVDEESRAYAGPSLCPMGFSPMRPETSGEGFDPLGICAEEGCGIGTPYMGFDEFLPLWSAFLDFWVSHPSVACTDVVIIRYEDLVTSTSDVLGIMLREAGLEAKEEDGQDGISRAVEKFSVDEERLLYNVFFNRALQYNDTIIAWANFTLTQASGLAESVGYLSFLAGIVESGVERAHLLHFLLLLLLVLIN